MIEQFLNRIMGSLKDNESSDRRFRNEAAKNDKTLFSSIKDLSKRFSISEQNIDSINDSIESTNVEVQRSNQKIDSMQGLIRESISMQAQMLTELGAIKSDFKDLKESIEKISGASGGNIVGNFLNDLKQGAKSLGLGAASLAGLGGIDALVDMFKENFGGFDTTGELTGGSPGASESGETRRESAGRGSQTRSESYGSLGNLKDFIASGEGNYESSNRGTIGNSIIGSTHSTLRGDKKLSEMTIGEIMEYQSIRDPRNKNRLFAVGKYQIIPSTMREVVSGLGVKQDEIFTPELQEKMGDYLIMNKRPAVGRYIRGESDNLFAAQLSLAQEFASIPNPRTGRSFYGSGNRSAHSVNEVKEALQQAREKYTTKSNNVEGDDSGTHKSGAMPKSDPTGNNSGGNVRYTNQGATRNQDIKPRLMAILQNAAKEVGVDVEIFSGGQPKKGSGGKRVGSTRHDDGNAADIILKRGKETVLDKKTIGQFIAAAARGGATGIGHGPGYMQPGGIHIGFGKPAVWGAGGRSKNAPGWVRSAASGVFSNENLQDDSNGAQGNGTNSSYGAPGATVDSLDFSGFSALESGLAGLGISLPTGGLLSAVSKIFGVDFGGFFGNLASAFGLTGGNVNDSQYQQQTSSQEIVNDTPEISESIKLALSGPLFGSRSVTPAGESQSRSNTSQKEADDFPGNFIENIQRNFSLVMDTMSKEKTITQENQPASPQDYTTMAMSAPNVDYNGGNRWYINPEKTAFANWARGDNWVIEPISGIKKNQPEWFNRTMFA